MAFDPITMIRSTTLVVDRDNIDTDQIIPARFLTTTSRDGLADGCFADWRFDDQGRPRADDPFRDEMRNGAGILVAGENFGCGSSREHAPWALLAFGFRAVLAPSIADIFGSNALRNGLLVVSVDEDAHARLVERPGGAVVIDLLTNDIRLDGEPLASFTIDPFARDCLLDGVDELGALIKANDAVAAFERRRDAL